MAWGREKIVIAVGQQGQGSDSVVLISANSSFLTRDAVKLCHRYQRNLRKVEERGNKTFSSLKKTKCLPDFRGSVWVSTQLLFSHTPTLKVLKYPFISPPATSPGSRVFVRQ